MVVTLKSGIQIRQTVEEYTVEKSALLGELRGLKWTFGDTHDVNIKWMDVGEVAAIHSELEPGDAGAPA